MKLRKEGINEGFSESITVNHRICIDMLRLSLDSTCKVRVAGVQGVLLMVFLSYKGMSSHVTLRVLMVLMR